MHQSKEVRSSQGVSRLTCSYLERAAEKKPAKPTSKQHASECVRKIFLLEHKKGEELLPPPIAGDDAPQSNPEYTVDGKAYCPMDEALPLGKKPLPSAFRKTSNVIQKFSGFADTTSI